MTADLIFESLECAVLVIDENRIIQTVNLASETLFCQSRRYLIGRNINELLSNDSVDRCIDDCFDNHSKYTLREIPIEKIGDPILVDITLSSILERSLINDSVLIEINSINRISRFMKEKNQMERQQSFRMMMRGLAHEIKNPLGGIRGASQLLHKEIVDPSRRELTEILIKEADRLTRLVDRVMGSREQLKPSLLNIHEVLEHVFHLITVKSKEKLSVDRFYDPTLPEIVADKEQLIQAVLNIVMNAVEAQKKSKKIEIGFITQFERSITINRKMYRQVMNIRIWDNGPGVPEKIKDVIFDPLITGRPEGTGLGLSITQEIIQRHNGAVKLEEINGKTCFSIYLPYTEEADLVSLESQ